MPSRPSSALLRASGRRKPSLNRAVRSQKLGGPIFVSYWKDRIASSIESKRDVSRSDITTLAYEHARRDVSRLHEGRRATGAGRRARHAVVIRLSGAGIHAL